MGLGCRQQNYLIVKSPQAGWWCTAYDAISIVAPALVSTLGYLDSWVACELIAVHYFYGVGPDREP
jgi:hypothetical protein